MELQASSPYFTYSYIDASGVDLTLCSAPGGPRQELTLRANYGGASHPEGSVAVEDGDLLIRNLYLSTAADIREYDNYRRAAMRQINVPDGSVTVDKDSYLSTYSSSVWNSYDSSSGVLTIDSPAADDVHILAKALIVEGTCSAWSLGQENVRGNIISAPSIRFENCYVSITQTGGERRGRFQSTPVCADPSKAVETQEDNGWNTDYYYVYDNMPQDSRPVPAFTDVAEDAWYYENVRYACQAGLMQGKSSTTFAPNDELTVAEAVKLACCIHQWEQERRVTLTNGSPWYATYMDYALEKGIIVEDLSARANEPITRQEYILMFDRAIPDELPEINTVEDGAIPDVNMGGGTEAIIYKFYRAGILTGGTGGAFLPDSPIKRSEVCAVLTRIMDPDSRVSFTLTA